MNTYPVVLRDADEIEEFFLATTGMKPGYLQLSRGLADLRLRVVELAGVTLVWTRARGRARWRDQMTGDGLHIGFAVESDGPITVQGHDVSRDEAQIWLPDKEMDLILAGPNLTLDLGVDADVVEELGWEFAGDPLQKVPHEKAAQLLNTCQRVTESVRGMEVHAALRAQRIEAMRDLILDQLEPVLHPWLAEASSNAGAQAAPHYDLVRRADAFFEDLGIEASFEVDMLSKSLGVPRRTLFHAFRKLLGVGPRRYLELKRLHKLRARLRNSAYTDATVSSVATELGFTDMGRLAGIYRRQFGETPSETLKFG